MLHYYMFCVLTCFQQSKRLLVDIYTNLAGSFSLLLKIILVANGQMHSILRGNITLNCFLALVPTCKIRSDTHTNDQGRHALTAADTYC